MTSGNHADAVVVGGGAVGCATAYELLRRGLRVTLVERDGIASHASGFAYGGLYATTGAGIPGPVLPIAKECVELHRALAGAIREQTGLDNGFRPAESIEIAFDEHRVEWLRAAAEWQRREGFAVKQLDRKGVLELEPSVSPDVIGGALHTSHYEVDSYKYTFGLGWAFEKLGGNVVAGSVRSITAAHGRVTGVLLANGMKLPAGIVVVATGPWAATAAIDGVDPLPIHSARGEILRLEFPGGDFNRRVTLEGHYVARKPDGLVWAGTTEETVEGFDDRPTEAARASIMEGVIRLAPGLDAARLVTQTACLRPVARDGLPIIGRGALEGAYVANGAGKKGILLSPAMARMLVSLALDGDESAVPPPFRSARFT